MAEWLGIGLQNRVQQFESAWHLSKMLLNNFRGIFLLLTYIWRKNDAVARTGLGHIFPENESVLLFWCSFGRIFAQNVTICCCEHQFEVVLFKNFHCTSHNLRNIVATNSDLSTNGHDLWINR